MILVSLFQDGAVLQRDMDIPVWGRCDPGVPVKVSLDGRVSHARSASSGDFLLYLPAHGAGGPYELSVSAGEESVTLKDILIGEVWLASGQSNMEYRLSSDWRVGTDGGDSLGRRQERHFNEMVMDAERFRFFTVFRTADGALETGCAGTWRRMTGLNSGDASAVAAWFGLGLQYQLNVPVGLIISAVGGTIAEAWTSYETLCRTPETVEMADGVRRSFWNSDRRDMTRIFRPDPGNGGEALGYARPDFDDRLWRKMTVGGSWIKQRIAGNGAVWARKHVDLPESWAGCPLTLVGGTVDKHDITYFNGVETGRTGKGCETTHYNVPRRYRIPGELVRGGENVIAIRAFSFAYDGSIGGPWSLVKEDDGSAIDLRGNDWCACAEFDWGKIAPDVSADSYGPGNVNTPTILFNGMIHPLIPYAMRGVIWYQGESNARSVEISAAYRNILRAMIEDWRRWWRMPEMPFFMVQLAGYGVPEAFSAFSSWAELRESQRLIAVEDPHTFLASAIDVGEPEDIHPQNKLDVGKRLAMCVLHHVYGCREVVPSGPEAVRCEAENGSVRIFFKYAEGLSLKSDKPAFFLSGADGEFFAADKVEIDGETLLVASAAVSEPFRVCYAWADFPETPLYNGAGFPAPSFRMEVVRK